MQDKRKQQYSGNKLIKRLQRQVGTAITDFNMIENGEFDTIYHEHLDYHRVKPLQLFFDRHGLCLVDVAEC